MVVIKQARHEATAQLSVLGKRTWAGERKDGKHVSDYIVQVRAVVKGILGPDSSEYEMVGGTRASERKKPKK